MIGVGEKAPSFSLLSPDGKPVSLAQLLDAGPLLLLFVSEECPTSRLTLARLAAIRKPLQAGGASIVAIHQDAPDVAAATMRECDSDFLALCEPAPFVTASAFGIATVPTIFLLSTEGRVLDVCEGWSFEDLSRMAARVAELGGCEPARIASDEPRQKPGCCSKNVLDAAALTGMEKGAHAFDELEDMFERGWTDGLPVIPPTPERVKQMLGGREPEQSLGLVPPGMGELTLERLAACAVLAGCQPAYFPVVMAAAGAVLDPGFNIHGVTNTTHTVGPVLMVNGPIRHRIGMNCGINAMGGWNRANATIGRAIRLVCGLTGQGKPGTLDRSTLGQPGKISFCFAENEEASPWEPLSVTRGFADGESVVTVYAGDCPLTVSDHYSQDPAEIVTSIALAGAVAFSPHWYPVGTETVFVLSPEHARTLADAGWSKTDVATRIMEGTRRRAGELRGGEETPLTKAVGDEVEVTKWMSPQEIVIVVTGGPAGRFSAILPPWIGFGLGSRMVSRVIEEE